MVKECSAAVKAMTEEKQAELAVIETWLKTALDIDESKSTRYTLLCPLLPGETPPGENLQLLSNFEIR